MTQYLSLVNDGNWLTLTSIRGQKTEDWPISSVEFAPGLFSQDTVSSFELGGRDADYHVIYHPGPRAEQWNGIKSYVDMLLKAALIGVAVRDVSTKRSPLDRGESLAGAAFLLNQGKNGLNIFKDFEDAQKHFRDARRYHTEGYYYKGDLLIRGVIKRSDIKIAR